MALCYFSIISRSHQIQNDLAKNMCDLKVGAFLDQEFLISPY